MSQTEIGVGAIETHPFEKAGSELLAMDLIFYKSAVKKLTNDQSN